MTAWVVEMFGHVLNVPGEAVAVVAVYLQSEELMRVAIVMKSPAWACYVFACNLRSR